MKINKSKVRMGLSIASCIGVGVTACAGIYEGRKADPNQNAWQNYKYTILSFAVTEACMIGSHKIGSKQLAAMGGLLASSKALYDKTESKIREVVGNDKFEQIKKEVIKERASEKLQNTDALDIPGKGDELFYEPATDQFFYATREQILKAYSEINHDFIHDPREVYGDNGDGVMTESALGVSVNDWIKMIKKYVPKCKLVEPDYCEEDFGWFWGDSGKFWDCFWVGRPWISMEFINAKMDSGEPYTILDYGGVDPDWAFADTAFATQNKKNLEEAKMRWENEYA